jgi:hypothetical protein
VDVRLPPRSSRRTVVTENTENNVEKPEPVTEEDEETPEIVAHSADNTISPCGSHTGSCGIN